MVRWLRCLNCRYIYLGLFDSEVEAARFLNDHCLIETFSRTSLCFYQSQHEVSFFLNIFLTTGLMTRLQSTLMVEKQSRTSRWVHTKMRLTLRAITLRLTSTWESLYRPVMRQSKMGGSFTSLLILMKLSVELAWG